MKQLAAIALVPLVMVACKEPSKAPPPPPPPAKKAPPPPPAPPPKPKAPTAGTAVPEKREATKEEVKAAIAELTKKVKAGATDPKNPWAMAHGLLVFGKGMKTSDGKSAIDAIVRDSTITLTVDGRELRGFSPKLPDGTPVDPHGNMIVKSLLEAGVPESKKFKLNDGKTVTLKQLADDAEWVMLVPNDVEGWSRFAWTEQLLLLRHEPGGAVSTKLGKKTMLELALRSIHALEEQQQVLTRLLEEGKVENLEKNKTGIYKHACGGLHFVQAVALAAKHQNDSAMLAKVRKQLEVVMFRWEGERRIYRRFVKEHPKARLLILVQELKFYGHVLETFTMLSKAGVIELDAAKKKQLREVAGDLLHVIKELDVAYGRLDDVKARSAQSYYDLIGDGCHAIRGLREALVAVYAD